MHLCGAQIVASILSLLLLVLLVVSLGLVVAISGLVGAPAAIGVVALWHFFRGYHTPASSASRGIRLCRKTSYLMGQ